MRQRAWVFVLAAAGFICPAELRAQKDDAEGEINKLLNRGIALIKSAKPREAVEPFTAALAKAEKVLGNSHLTTERALSWLGRAYSDSGDYREAEPLYKRCLDIKEKALGKDHPDVATSLRNLAALYRAMGRYGEAEPLYRRSLAIMETALGKDHPSVAQSLNGPALLYMATGRYAEAEPLFNRSLEINEKALGKDHPHVATSLDNLAALYRATGRYAESEPFSKRCLAIREKAVGKDHPDVATSLNSLAGLYMDTGRYAEAEPLYKRSLAIREKALGKDHPHVALSLHNLAVLYRATRRHAEAEPLHKRSLAINEKALGKDHPHVAQSLNRLALLYQDTGRHAKAELLHKRSLAIREKALGKDHPDVGVTLNNLAMLYRDTGRYAEAEPLFKRDLAICEKSLGKDHPEMGASLNNLAILLEALRRTGEAATLFDRARRGSRRHVSLVLPSLPPADQAAFLSAKERSLFEAALSMALPHADDGTLAERSATWLLNGKAVAEEALTQSALLARDSRDPGAGKLAARLRQARASLARLALAAPATGQEKPHRQRLEELTTQERDLARDLAAAGGASALAADWLDLDRLRQVLTTDAVLIDVARFNVFDFKAPVGKRWKPARYAAWVTPAKGDVKVIDLGDAAAIDAAVKDVRVAFEGAHKVIRAKGEPAAESALREPLAKLSKLVLTPLLPHVGEAKRWVVSPDGNLWLVPWEILLLPDGKYAVEKHTLSYVSSGRDLVTTSQWKGKPGVPLVVADPDFDLDSKTARAQGARLLGQRDEDVELRGLSSLLRLGNIRRLPNSRAEAEAIAKPLATYTGQPPVSRLDKEALEGVVKAAKNPRVLVLTTHGFFLPTERVKPTERPGEKAAAPPGWENPLLRCGLLFAGCNDAAKATDGDDGVLTGLEVVGMDLRGCEMVVLSACETGVGDVQNGEGVAGLRQAFRLAGAEAVVSTLWQVPDRSSAQLMTLFFANLAKGKDRASALREAQLKLIEERRYDSAAAHPFFWAAFTLTGR